MGGLDSTIRPSPRNKDSPTSKCSNKMLVTGKKGRTSHREILSLTPESVSEFTAKLIENVVEVSKFVNIVKFFISGSIVKFPVF